LPRRNGALSRSQGIRDDQPNVIPVYAAGEVPFIRDSDIAVVFAHLEDPPPKPKPLARHGAWAQPPVALR
jgi:hypothetical protein